MKFRKILGTGLVALSALSFVSCGNGKKDKTGDDTTKGEVGLSASTYDIDKEYYYSDYNTKDLKIFDKKEDIVFENVSYEELIYILESEGNHLILFGGSWCHNTKAAIGYINDFANQYGIDTIYNFDFRLDGVTSNSHIRESNSSTKPGAEYNYLYGELVSRYLTNLNDWVEYQEDTASALKYTNKDGEEITVAKAQVPFLFLYNKDNTVNNSKNTTSTAAKNPIVYGFEEMVDRDSDGVYVVTEYNPDWTPKSKRYITPDYLERLEKIFKYIKDNNVTLADYHADDYVREAFNEKSNKTLFQTTDQINYQTVGYKELTWLLEQDGNSLILLGGSWCGNTQAVINTINDYAVKNNLTVYLYDTRIDSGISNTRYGYRANLNSRAHGTRAVNGEEVKGFGLYNLYTDLIENYLTNITTLYDKTKGSSYRIEYTNAAGELAYVAKAQVPYLLSYNKDAKDELGLSAPITGYYEEMLSLSESSKTYTYKADVYAKYTAGTKAVFEAYAKNLDVTIEEITFRPTVA